jgi:hypothetical protein
MITDIRPNPQAVCVLTNGGKQVSTQIGDLQSLSMVWYNPESITNILSLSDVGRYAG